jgi:hypothetical protein
VWWGWVGVVFIGFPFQESGKIYFDVAPLQGFFAVIANSQGAASDTNRYEVILSLLYLRAVFLSVIFIFGCVISLILVQVTQLARRYRTT